MLLEVYCHLIVNMYKELNPYLVLEHFEDLHAVILYT